MIKHDDKYIFNQILHKKWPFLRKIGFSAQQLEKTFTKNRARTLSLHGIQTFNLTIYAMIKCYNISVLSAIILCGILLLSCNKKADNAVTPNPVSGPAYQLDQQVVERRECHALQNLGNDILNLKFRQIIFEYNSLGPDMTTPVRLTGVISMNPAVYNKVESPRGLMLYNEFTCAKHGERTSQNEIDDIGFYMNKFQNIIAVSADLYGWTLTEDQPQAYCCPEITSVETMDAWDAAMLILEEEGYNISGLPTFNVGYSSGGFSAIAVQRYTDKNRTDDFWTLTSAGGAPFSIHSVYLSNIASETSGYACSFPLVVVAYKETYNLSINYSDVFVEPLASHIQEWILSKDYGTWEINKLIAGSDELAQNCPVDMILTPAALDVNSDISKKLDDKFIENSLCGAGQTWQPSTKTKFYIMHSIGDKYIDWHVGQEMAGYLKTHGCNVKSDFFYYGNHVTYGLLKHIGSTMLLMEDYMLGGEEIKPQLQHEIIDKTMEYVNDDTEQIAGISL